jgi:NTP pyrophosphatase (non-canonical NTP hydrolase)
MGYGSKSITDWVEDIVEWGKRKGWDVPICESGAKLVDHATRSLVPPQVVDHDGVLALLMLVNTELSEAAEEARSDRWLEWKDSRFPEKPEGFVVELADAVIRIFHLAGKLGLPLEDAIRQKMRYNETRPHRHGGKKA